MAGSRRKTTGRRKAAGKSRRRTPRKPVAHPDALAMISVINGFWVTQLVHVAAELDLADRLAKGPQTAEALAKQAGVDPVALARVLRALASVGIFKADAKGRYTFTPLARTLRSDHPASLRDFARMMVADYNWRAWGGLLESVRDGSVAFERVHGMPFFQHLQRNPEKERVFSASMASISGAENPTIATSYPFGELTRLVDVRGDFFASVPAGADGYLMKHILHDWDDERCVRILRLCREAMAPGGRVLVVDHVIPPGNAPHRGKLMDLNMFVLLTGKERTKAEFAALFAEAGLRLRRVVPTGSPIALVEGVRA
jgi:hypothetical protein